MHYSFAPAAGSDPHLASIFLLQPLRSDRSPSKQPRERIGSAPAALQPNTCGAEPSQPAPAAVWMGSGESGSAPGVIYPQDTRLLCLSKFEERSRSAPVSPLPSPSSVPPSLAPGARNGGGAHARNSRGSDEAHPGPTSESMAGGARPRLNSRTLLARDRLYSLVNRKEEDKVEKKLKKKKKRSESMTCGSIRDRWGPH
jgi:hypothetical protein